MTVSEIIHASFPDGSHAEVRGNVSFLPTNTETLISVCECLHQHYHLRLMTMVATDERADHGVFKILYVFGVPSSDDVPGGAFIVPYVTLKHTEEFPSLVATMPEVFGYERKIKTFMGLQPVGHPNPQMVHMHSNWPADVCPLRKDVAWNARPKKADSPYEYAQVDGEGMYVIPVGPVHAGIIEPGHFRFNVAGEEIVLLDAQLGWVHKGSEKLFEVLPMDTKLKLSERISGDSSFNHSLAFCQAVEQLAGIEAPERARVLRVVFAELERLVNHLNDIGFIMLDTAYTFGGSQCARLRERVMQLNERLTGSRFLRGVNTFGGVTCDMTAEHQHLVVKEVAACEKDLSEVLDIAENSAIMIDRLHATGVLTSTVAGDLGAVGIAARACGIDMDARRDFPYAAYGDMSVPVATEQDGDVYARWMVRIKEVGILFGLLKQAIAMLTKYQKTELVTSFKEASLRPNAYAIGVTETWRGDVVYVVATDAKGEVSRVDVRDPSFLNWPVALQAVKGNMVPDFPLINKSFNLSYSGNDV